MKPVPEAAADAALALLGQRLSAHTLARVVSELGTNATEPWSQNARQVLHAQGDARPSPEGIAYDAMLGVLSGCDNNPNEFDRERLIRAFLTVVQSPGYMYLSYQETVYRPLAGSPGTTYPVPVFFTLERAANMPLVSVKVYTPGGRVDPELTNLALAVTGHEGPWDQQPDPLETLEETE